MSKPVMMEYEAIRPTLKTGDLLAFGGSGHMSDIIKFGTRSHVSHVGMVLANMQLGMRSRVLMMDSTSLDGHTGVIITVMSRRVEVYDGDIWVLRLSEITRERLNEAALIDFACNQDGKDYDGRQAVLAGLDFGIVKDRFEAQEDHSKMFCSEFWAASVIAGHAVPHWVNSSEQTPIDVCRWELFEPQYFQIKGEEKEIRGYNSVVPEKIA